MANPVIRSFAVTPSTVSPGQSATGVVDAYDPDNRTVTLQAKVGDSVVRTTLTVEDNPVPNPVFTEVDAAGNPVGTPSVDFVVDPSNPFQVTITPRAL